MKLFGWSVFASAVMAAGWGALMRKFSGEQWVGWMTGSIMFAVIFAALWATEKGPVSEIEEMYRRRFDD